jgi:hypothetical protein
MEFIDTAGGVSTSSDILIRTERAKLLSVANGLASVPAPLKCIVPSKTTDSGYLVNPCWGGRKIKKCHLHPKIDPPVSRFPYLGTDAAQYFYICLQIKYEGKNFQNIKSDV